MVSTQLAIAAILSRPGLWKQIIVAEKCCIAARSWVRLSADKLDLLTSCPLRVAICVPTVGLSSYSCEVCLAQKRSIASSRRMITLVREAGAIPSDGGWLDLLVAAVLSRGTPGTHVRSYSCDVYVCRKTYWPVYHGRAASCGRAA